MVDTEILEAVKALRIHLQAQMQTQLEDQAVTYHHSLQKNMAALDARIKELKLQLMGTPVQPTTGRTSYPIRTPLSFSPEMEATHHLRPMKMEIPKFDRTDPNGWVFRIEEFFDFHQTPANLRLRIVSFHMEERALA